LHALREPADGPCLCGGRSGRGRELRVAHRALLALRAYTRAALLAVDVVAKTELAFASPSARGLCQRGPPAFTHVLNQEWNGDYADDREREEPRPREDLLEDGGRQHAEERLAHERREPDPLRRFRLREREPEREQR